MSTTKNPESKNRSKAGEDRLAVLFAELNSILLKEVENNTLILLRIPASQSSEREQLFNLIDLLHKEV